MYENKESSNAAIQKTTGPCVVLAGAGTGKTYLIVQKIKYLVENSIYKPERIVAITFSNEAANTLAARVNRELSNHKNEVIIKTIHAFAAMLIKNNNQQENPIIIDTDEAKLMLHTMLKVEPINCHRYVNTIATAKDQGISWNELEEYIMKKTQQKTEEIKRRLEDLQIEHYTTSKRERTYERIKRNEKIHYLKRLLEIYKVVGTWRGYEKIKEKRNEYDYADLNKQALRILRENQTIADEYDYLIIDEFQDTNKVQLDIILELAKHGNITIVGDMNQSIYRFRGAYKENLATFIKKYNIQEADIYTLNKSYRSPNTILAIAHELIKRNYHNPEEGFIMKNAQNREGRKAEVYEMQNSKEEVRKILQIVQEEIDAGTPYEEICIMVRTHQQGRVITKVLETNNIPYQAVGKESILKQRSIKKLIHYLTIVNNIQKDEKGEREAWWELIYQSNIPEEDLIQIGHYLKEEIKNGRKTRDLLESLEKKELTQKGKEIVRGIIEKIKKLLTISKDTIPDFLTEAYTYLNIEKDKETIMSLGKLYETAKEHAARYASDLDTFLHYLKIREQLGIGIEIPLTENKGVRIMTLHATKGLEYKTVIVTNLAERRFPIEKNNKGNIIPLELLPEYKEKQINDIEGYERVLQLSEERRLCYVACTRAKERLVFTYANEYGGKNHTPSCFLNEIEYKKNKNIIFTEDRDFKYTEEIILLPQTNVQREQEDRVFSPSSLLLFDECQKKFEYKYLYNMPEPKKATWEEMRLGSFVHLILEQGVKKNYKTLAEFNNLAQELSQYYEWKSLNIDETLFLIRVFFERNKNKYNEQSKTEQQLRIQLGELNFLGFADRIDFNEGGMEIIDYKTGKSFIPAKNRNWQLGYYAIAASRQGKVKKITLDMLNHEKPLEFEIDDRGNAHSCFHERLSFNIYEVQEELQETAKKIEKALKEGFKPCSLEKNCDFCNEYVYNH